MGESQGTGPGRLKRSVGGVAITAVVAILLLIWSWGSWADVIMDFGRELYIPWRLTEGDVLYRDLAYFNGPLSPHLNALWFRLLGTHAWTLFSANLVILTGITSLIYRLALEVTDHRSATVASVAFLSLCAFPHYHPYASFNFVAPYSHEITHGLLLSLLGLASVWKAAQGRPWGLPLAGLFLGLTLLTKPEVALAAAAGIGCGVLLVLARPGAAFRSRGLLGFVLGIVAPMVAMALSTRELGMGWTVHAIVVPWVGAANAEVRELFFYRSGMGLTAPLGNLLWMSVWTAVTLGVISAPGLAVRWLPERLRLRSTVGLWSFLVTLPIASGLAVAAGVNRSVAFLLPLLLALTIASVTAIMRQGRGRLTPERILTTSVLLFSSVLLLKLGLRPRLTWYGFALAAPALVCAVLWMLHDLPDRLERRGGEARAVVGAVLALLLPMILVHLAASNRQYSPMTRAIGTGGDRIRTDVVRGAALDSIHTRVRQILPAEGTLMVIPEGAMTNYLLRIPNPTPFVNFMPPELILFGEEKMVESVRERPPDLLVRTAKPVSGYDLEFGTGYERLLSAEFDARYRELYAAPVKDFGGGPFTARLFGRR